MSSVNDQITDAMSQINAMLLGSSASQSMAMLDITSTESLGMSMLNAVSAQQNGQTSASASTTASCARMIQAQTSQSGKKDDMELAEQKAAVTMLVAALYNSYKDAKANADAKPADIETALTKMVASAVDKTLDLEPKLVTGAQDISNKQIKEVVSLLSPTPSVTPAPHHS